MIAYGYKWVRPETFIVLESAPPPSLWRRIMWTIDDVWWAFLTAIAPVLPIIGALLGALIARVLLS